jgi:hypothetical protein
MNFASKWSVTFQKKSSDGNFLYALHQVLTEDYGHTSEDVMDRLYGVELMEDNVAEAKRRLPGAHIVCHDALTFDYDSW